MNDGQLNIEKIETTNSDFIYSIETEITRIEPAEFLVRLSSSWDTQEL